MMRGALAVVFSFLLAASVGAAAADFSEATTVHGKIEADIKGVWLLVTRAEVGTGKYKTFPQLIKVEKGEGGLEMHILDVDLPEAFRTALHEANFVTLAAWEPSGEQLKALSEGWSKLTPAVNKKMTDFHYDKVEYKLVAPESYAEVFPKQDGMMKKAIEGSVFVMQIIENYRPNPNIPAGSNVSQLMRRHTVYGVKKAEKDLIQGAHTLGFITAGAGFPIPLQFQGSFAMYRLGP